MFETQNLFLQQEENTMNAIENRMRAVPIQENAIRKKLDQFANQGITQYKFPDGIILDEVANNLTADGYDVTRWFFANPEESFSMIYFDHSKEGVPGHLYDYHEYDCCNCTCKCCCNECCACGSCLDDDCECDNCCNGDCASCGCSNHGCKSTDDHKCDSGCNGNCGCDDCCNDKCKPNDDHECGSCSNSGCVCGCPDLDCCCGSYLNGGYGCSYCSTDNSEC